jgi:hypothetical protein
MFALMKNSMLCCIMVCFMFPMVNGSCQNDAKSVRNNEVTVAPTLVKFATQMGFKYEPTLEKAKKGDLNAIKDMMEFHGTTDGTDALNHAQTCLELIPVATDDRIGLACQNLKPKLKTLLLERFTLAQGRTKNTELQKPLKDWAPGTWAVLNNLPFECASCEAAKKMAEEYTKNADGSLSKNNPQGPGQDAAPTTDQNMDGMKPAPGSPRGADAPAPTNQTIAPPAKKEGGN